MNSIKTIDYASPDEITIKIGRIKDFSNICKVSGKEEKINIEVEYVPSDKLIELASYRDYFYHGQFNEYIEDLACKTFHLLADLLNPKYLKVIVHLCEKTLTPWSVTAEGHPALVRKK